MNERYKVRALWLKSHRQRLRYVKASCGLNNNGWKRVLGESFDDYMIRRRR